MNTFGYFSLLVVVVALVDVVVHSQNLHLQKTVFFAIVGTDRRTDGQN